MYSNRTIKKNKKKPIKPFEKFLKAFKILTTSVCTYITMYMFITGSVNTTDKVKGECLYSNKPNVCTCVSRFSIAYL